MRFACVFISGQTENILDDDYCGRYEFNHPIAGLQAVEANAVLQFPNDSITAIAVTETHDYTVAFLGTDNGQLKKVRRNWTYHVQFG